jgi:hypothetical protein
MLAALTSRTCSLTMALAAFAIIGCLTKAPAAFAGTRRARRATLAAIAITLTSATPSSSERSGVAEVVRLQSLVETEGARALPGCTIKYESFTQVMWRPAGAGCALATPLRHASHAHFAFLPGRTVRQAEATAQHREELLTITVAPYAIGQSKCSMTISSLDRGFPL